MCRKWYSVYHTTPRIQRQRLALDHVVWNVAPRKRAKIAAADIIAIPIDDILTRLHAQCLLHYNTRRPSDVVVEGGHVLVHGGRIVIIYNNFTDFETPRGMFLLQAHNYKPRTYRIHNNFVFMSECTQPSTLDVYTTTGIYQRSYPSPSTGPFDEDGALPDTVSWNLSLDKLHLVYTWSGTKTTRVYSCNFDGTMERECDCLYVKAMLNTTTASNIAWNQAAGWYWDARWFTSETTRANTAHGVTPAMFAFNDTTRHGIMAGDVHLGHVFHDDDDGYYYILAANIITQKITAFDPRPGRARTFSVCEDKVIVTTNIYTIDIYGTRSSNNNKMRTHVIERYDEPYDTYTTSIKAADQPDVHHLCTLDMQRWWIKPTHDAKFVTDCTGAMWVYEPDDYTLRRLLRGCE